jgi:protein gp37
VQAERLKRFGKAKYAQGFEFKVHPKDLNWPLTQKKPERIFVNSMSDMAHEDMPQEFFNAMMDTIQLAHWHTFQILTKRPKHLIELLVAYDKPVPANVWIGVSVENPTYLWRIDLLRSIQCSVRFISFEPLLASVAGANLAGIQWVIVGGESGSNRRPFDLQWAREIRDLCLKRGIAFFYKQGSAFRPGQNRELDGREWNEFPQAVTCSPAPTAQH